MSRVIAWAAVLASWLAFMVYSTAAHYSGKIMSSEIFTRGRSKC